MVLIGVHGETRKSCPASPRGDDMARELLAFGGGRRELRRGSDYDGRGESSSPCIWGSACADRTRLAHRRCQGRCGGHRRHSLMDPFAGLSFFVEGALSEVAPSKPHAVSHLAMEGALGVERTFCQVVWGNSGRHASVPSLAAFGDGRGGVCGWPAQARQRWGCGVDGRVLACSCHACLLVHAAPVLACSHLLACLDGLCRTADLEPGQGSSAQEAIEAAARAA